MANADAYQCDSDQELSVLLHRLLVTDGNDSVTIQHPTEGEKTITRKEYLEKREEQKRLRELSPAQRLQEQKRIERLNEIKARRMENRFRTKMISAKVYTINLDDEDSFGKDVEGNELDIEGLAYLPVEQYPEGIQTQENEIGCFLDETMTRPPIRLCSEAPAPQY